MGWVLPDRLPDPLGIHTVVFDFDGVFTNNKVWVDGDGREWVRCDRSDGLAFDLVRACRKRGMLTARLMVLSKETNSVVVARAAKLQLECHHGVDDKEKYLAGLLQARLPDEEDPFRNVVYLGNDLNDFAVMTRVGCAIAPADAHPRIREIAHHVLPERGGEGFVRGFIERWLGIDCWTTEELKYLVSDSRDRD